MSKTVDLHCHTACTIPHKKHSRFVNAGQTIKDVTVDGTEGWLRYFDYDGEQPQQVVAEEPVKPVDEEAAPEESGSTDNFTPTLETVKESMTVPEMKKLLKDAKVSMKGTFSKEEKLAKLILEHGLWKHSL